MSAASEWAEKMRTYQRAVDELEAQVAAAEQARPEGLTFSIQRNNGVAMQPRHVAFVKDSGELDLIKTAWLTPSEALAFADWIRATFSEGPR